jgi:hypothetical protein
LVLHRGRYHTDRHPGSALQNTAKCPGELHLHGVTAEDVAAIIWQQVEGR